MKDPAVTEDSVAAEARQLCEEMVSFCQHHEGTVLELEKRLFVLWFRLGCVLVRLMLAHVWGDPS